ncbi:MAG: response regulator [Gemmataceae bacterium]
MSETVLIVDDEESVRRTEYDWLANSGLGLNVLAAADAEEALRLANSSPIDLAVLDWNLGAGNDGLQLLEDLSVFHPDIVAILVTGYAHQATPLAAMRMGVRDYLDKNQDLDRTTFLASVRKQLDRIRPAKRQRELHASLAAFRSAVEKILPLVRSASTMNESTSSPRAVASLCRFTALVTGAADAVLFFRRDDDGRAYDANGNRLADGFVPFARSVAAAAVSRGEPCVLNDLAAAASAAMELQPFERGRSALLAVPLDIGSGGQAVLELFDRPGGFRDEDRRLAAAAAEVGAELVRQALADWQSSQALFAAVSAALDTTQSVAGASTLEEPPPAAVLESIRGSLGGSVVESTAALRLAEAVREMAARYGEPAVEHCIRVVESARNLLDSMG